MEHRSVARGPAHIAYRVEGEGPAVLLLPSLGRGAGDFDAVAPRLAAASAAPPVPWRA
jgi:pimeloyl-ACP methyl ester carboxylesterase